jgi:hypothetical protein
LHCELNENHSWTVPRPQPFQRPRSFDTTDNRPGKTNHFRHSLKPTGFRRDRGPRSFCRKWKPGIGRGARNVVFVDKAQQSLRSLESNIKTLGCSDQCTAYTADVFWFLKNTHRAFDLVFVDPPYRLERIEDLPNAIYESPVVKEGSYVVMEHSKESQIALSDSMYDITRKAFGQTTVLLLRTKPKNSLPTL